MQMQVKEIVPLLIEPPIESVQQVLSQYRFSESAECRLLCRKKNLFYLVDDPSCGVKAVLRVSGLRRTAEQLSTEALWLSELHRDTNLPVPRLIRSNAGAFYTALSHPFLPRGYYGMVFSFVRGTQVEVNTRSFGALYQQMGELAAQLHQNAILWTGMNRLPRPVLDCDAINAALFEELEDRELLLHALAILRKRLNHFGRTPDRFGLIHADMRPANLLVENGRMTVLDFDDCGYGWFLYDFAASVSGMETHPLLPKMMKAWLGGYRNYRKISREEAEELPTFLLLHRLLQLDGKARSGQIPETFLQETIGLAEQYVHAHRQG